MNGLQEATVWGLLVALVTLLILIVQLVFVNIRVGRIANELKRRGEED